MIAYQTWRSFEARVQTITVSGGTPHLVRTGAFMFATEWSPDGSRILTQTNVGDFSIEIANADGTGRRVLVPQGEVPTYQRLGSWSPDGAWISFSVPVQQTCEQGTCSGGRQELTLIRPDGRDRRAITVVDEVGPWSPDASAIAVLIDDHPDKNYSARSESQLADDIDLHVVDVTDGRVTKVADIPVYEYGIEWSGDGRMFAFGEQTRIFRHEEPRQFNIHVVRADGSGYRRLSKDGASAPQFFSPR
jgi:Tol biopolymer transport system component